jgi:signal transduction histidine kinase
MVVGNGLAGMKADSNTLLENATWPALVVDHSGVIRAVNQAAVAVFGTILEGESPLLASLWPVGAESPPEQFLVRLDRAAGAALPLKLKVKGGQVLSFQCFGCAQTRDGNRSFTLQLFRDGHAPPAAAAEIPGGAVRHPATPDGVPSGTDPAAHRQKLECALQLSRTVALDFNNALTSILGHTSFVLGKMPADHPWRPSLMEAEKSAQKAAEISHDLAAFSRQEKDGRGRAEGNLNQLLRQTVALFEARGIAGLAWEVALEPRLHAIQVDEAKMQQALMKILENAVEAVPDPGLIRVRTSNHVVWEPQRDENVELAPGAYVCVEVSDNGEGISLDVLPRVFEPFFTTKAGHRGLGLAWVYGIVTNHGGSVAVSSPPAQGTSVRIYLPAMEALVFDQPLTDDALTGSETILLVDDEPILLTLGQTILSDFGYRVLTAQSGARALELYTQLAGEIQLVITDLVMPYMSGRELIEQLRARNPGVRVLQCSGFVRPAGGGEQDLYLQKPFTSQGLLRKVKQALTTTGS